MRSCIDARAAALMEEEPATPTHARRSCMYEAVLEQAARLGMYSVDPSALMSDLSMSLALNFLRDKQTEDGILERTAEMQREEGNGRLGAEVNGKAGTEGMKTEGNGTARVEANGSIHTESNGSHRTEVNGRVEAANGTLRMAVDEEASTAPEDGARPAAQMARNNSRGALRMSPQVRHDILELPAGFSGAPAEGGHSGMAAADKGETVALEKGGMVAMKKGEETRTSGGEPLVGDTVLAGSGRREPELSGTELSGTELSGRKVGELPERGSPSDSPSGSINRTFRGQAANGGIRFQVVRNELGVVKVEAEQVIPDKTEPVRAVQAERVKDATGKPFLEHARSQTETEWAVHSGTSGTEGSVTWKSPKVSKPEGSEKGSTFPTVGETSSQEGSPVRMDGSFVASMGSNGSPPANGRTDLDVKVKSRGEYSPTTASVGTDPMIPRKGGLDVDPTEQTSPGGTREATSKGSPTNENAPRRSSSGPPQDVPAESVRFSTAAGFLRKKTPRTDSNPKGDPSPLGGSPRGSVSSRSSPLAGNSLSSSPRDPDSPNRTSSYLAGTRGIQQLRELRKTQEKIVTAVRPSAAPLKVIPRRNSEPQLSRLSIPGHLGLDMMDSPGVKPSNPADAKAPKTSTISAQKSSPHASNGGQVTPPNGRKKDSPSDVTQGSPTKGRPQVKPLNLRALAEESPGNSNQSTPLSGGSEKSRKSAVADSYMDNLLERERLKGSKEAGRKPSPRLSPLPVSFPLCSSQFVYSFVPRIQRLMPLSQLDSSMQLAFIILSYQRTHSSSVGYLVVDSALVDLLLAQTTSQIRVNAHERLRVSRG